MRGVLESPALVKYAGRSVWLELDFDKPVNRGFLVSHGIHFTPTFFMLDPRNERVTATHFGSMTVPELTRFLEQGERAMRERAATPADAALARGDQALGAGRLAEAADAYRASLRSASTAWPKRARTLAQLTSTLRSMGEWQACAETAAAEAPRMTRGREFAYVTAYGLDSATRDSASTWSRRGRDRLIPLAAEAVALPEADPDLRFQLYDGLVTAAEMRGDPSDRRKWKDRWLSDLDSIRPRNDDERTALDIARVEAAQMLDEPDRFVQVLEASERAMPDNYVASLRLAQVLLQGKHYDAALAACDRGLAKVDGPVGRTWLHLLEAQAWIGQGDARRARDALALAKRSADAIHMPASRANNLKRVAALLAETSKP